MPELLENFVPRVKSLLVDKNHGVLITGVTLMIQMCDMEPRLIPLFREVVLFHRSRSYLLTTIVSTGSDRATIGSDFEEFGSIRL